MPLTRAYAGRSIAARLIDLMLIYTLNSLFQEPVAGWGLYFVYYAVAGLVDGQTVGRYAMRYGFARTDGRRPSRWLILVRDASFGLLAPLIFIQWVFGLRYSHERITGVIAVDAKSNGR